MKVKILNIDCRKEENRKIIQNELRKIKPFAKCPEGQDVSIEKLEKCIFVLSRNYDISYTIHADSFSSDEGIIWRFRVINNEDLSELGVCYGLSIYELMSKAAIMTYDITRKRNKV